MDRERYYIHKKEQIDRSRRYYIYTIMNIDIYRKVLPTLKEQIDGYTR